MPTPNGAGSDGVRHFFFTHFLFYVNKFMYFCIDSHINGIIMKTTKEYISLISSHADELKKVFGIKSLLIFGSVSRNEQHEGSDVDVCVEMQKPDMFSLVHIKEDLQQLFGRSVDIVRLRDNMNPMLSKQIQRDGIYV